MFSRSASPLLTLLAFCLQRDSTASAHSLSSFHDRVTALDKVNTDLTRKLKAAQLELENSASEHERIALDYQNRLDDLRGEVVGKRREEKELRGKERGYLIQIQTVSFVFSFQPLPRSSMTSSDR